MPKTLLMRKKQVPTGAIQPFAGEVAPDGWLICDGSPISRTSYPKLFETIGTAHGVGDGATTFNLPDLRGRFTRGVDKDAAGLPTPIARDPDRNTRAAVNGGNTGNAVGSYQASSNAAHRHMTITSAGGPSLGAAPTTTEPVSIGPGNAGNWGSYQLVKPSIAGLNANIGPTSSEGGEARPENIYVHYIIKVE